jgi:hypothetical protein
LPLQAAAKADTAALKPQRKAKRRTVRLADEHAAVVEERRRAQYGAGTQPEPVYRDSVFVHGPCEFSARNVEAAKPVMRLDEQPLSGNGTLTAAVELVVNLATLQLGKVDRVFEAYTNLGLSTRAEIYDASPSGTLFKGGLEHPDDELICTVMPQRGNPKCRCECATAAECKCPPGYPQNAMMLVRPGGPSSDGIVPVEDPALRSAVVAMSQQLGLTIRVLLR